jgi:hypothetical protein
LEVKPLETVATANLFPNYVLKRFAGTMKFQMTVRDKSPATEVLKRIRYLCNHGKHSQENRFALMACSESCGAHG